MWRVEKILVPTDWSEVAMAATELAIELAGRFRAGVVLFHAYQVPVYSYPATPYVPAADVATALEQAAEQGLEAVRRQYEGRGVEITTRVDAGIAWEQILAAVSAIDADLIVMGTHGRRGLPRAIMGSVAEKLVRLSPVPVLTVRQPAPDAYAEPTRGEEDPGAADELVDRWQI